VPILDSKVAWTGPAAIFIVPILDKCVYIRQRRQPFPHDSGNYSTATCQYSTGRANTRQVSSRYPQDLCRYSTTNCNLSTRPWHYSTAACQYSTFSHII